MTEQGNGKPARRCSAGRSKRLEMDMNSTSVIWVTAMKYYAVIGTSAARAGRTGNHNREARACDRFGNYSSSQYIGIRTALL